MTIIAITGAASGIGRGTAERFLAAGWPVVAGVAVDKNLAAIGLLVGRPWTTFGP